MRLLIALSLLLGIAACKIADTSTSAAPLDEYELYLGQKEAAWQGQVLPNWSLKMLDGKTVKLHELRGQPVLLSFWFTDCAPCLVEIPSLNQLRADFGEKGLKVIAIARDKAEAVRPFIQEKNIKYQMVANGQSFIDDLEVKVFPSNFLLDEKGRIVQVEQGGSSFDATLTYRQFKPKILELLAKQP